MFNPQRIKADFPIFKNLPQLIYLDSAASSFKPQLVLDKLNEYYTNYPVNISRGIYKLSEKATQEYEGARKKVAQFINAETSEEIIFTRNTTESINLVMYAWGMPNIKKGDEIVLTEMEHHSNIVPWQEYAKEKGLIIKYIKMDKFEYLKAKPDIIGDAMNIPLKNESMETHWHIYPLAGIAAGTYYGNLTYRLFPR